ncbi:MAG TPA: hypothetical protein VMW43_09900 [Bacteroidota bacterium]|nr:hypothetical protein [Bacteroidota bacterium]
MNVKAGRKKRQTRTEFEFDLLVGKGGRISLPPAVGKQLRPGDRFHVLLTEHRLAAELRRRNIDDELAGRIAARQHEPRENVLRFLLAEGSLSSDRQFRRSAEKGSARRP